MTKKKSINIISILNYRKITDGDVRRVRVKYISISFVIPAVKSNPPKIAEKSVFHPKNTPKIFIRNLGGFLEKWW